MENEQQKAWLGKDFDHKVKRWGETHLGGHGMVRRVDTNGKAWVWCRKCSGRARCRLVSKLMNSLQARNARARGHVEKHPQVKKIDCPTEARKDGKPRAKKRVTRKECKRRREELEVGGFMAQKKGLWNIAKKRMLKTEERCLKWRGFNQRIQNRARRENFLSSWLH